MMTKVKLRCSQLPKFMLCAGSAIPVRNPIIEAEPEFNDPAKLGTAVHQPLAHMVRDSNEEPELDVWAREYNVDIDDLAQLYYYGRKCWEMLREHFGSLPVAEQYFEREFPTFVLSGHPDMLSEAGMKPCAVADWKSGRVEYDASWQLFGAGPLCGATRGVIVWLRETWSGEAFDVVEFPSPEDIIKRLTAQVAAMDKGECTTGPHCNAMYCERQHECEAYQDMVRNSVSALAEIGYDETLPATELIAKLYHRWQDVMDFSKRFVTFMNEVLDTQGEIILPGGGSKLVRMTTHPKSFDAQKTLAVMEDFGIENPAECFKVAVTKLSKAVKDGAKAAGAKKGAHLTAFFEACEEVGALTYGERKMRKEIRV